MGENSTKDNPSSFSVISVSERFSKRFNTTAKIYDLKLNISSSESAEHQLKQLSDILKDIIKYCLLNNVTNEEYLIGFYIYNSPYLEYPIFISPRRPSQITVEHILHSVYAVSQSNTSWILETNNLILQVFQVELPSGAGRVQVDSSSLDNSIIKKKSVCTPFMDGICLLRAIVIGIAFHSGDKKEYNKVYLRKRIQTKKAKDFGRVLGLMNIHRILDPMGIEVIKKAQQYLKDSFRIILVSKSFDNKIIYDNKSDKTPLIIYEGVIQDQENGKKFKHYYFVKTMTGLLSVSYYCFQCMKGFSNQTRHPKKCLQNKICRVCMTKKCIKSTGETDPITCNQCNRTFPNIVCFNNHKNLTCAKIKKCLICNTLIRKSKRENHICEYIHCSCKRYHHFNDFCYMSKYTVPKRQGNRVLIIMDCETFLLDSYHKDILVVSQSICSLCKDIDSDVTDKGFKCSLCGERTRVFEKSPMESFIAYVIALKDIFSTITVTGLNLQGYDAQIIMQYLLKKGITPNICILNGRNIKYMTIGTKIRFIDMYNFVPIKLSMYPKTFNIKEDGNLLAKTFFPYKFASISNYYYKGPIPDIDYYEPYKKSPEECKELIKWHQEKCNDESYVFDFRKELIEYCINDVEITRMGACKFSKLFQDLAGFCPLENAMSISSASMLYFRKCFLKDNAIVMTSSDCFKKNHTYSKQALIWLTYIKNTRNLENLQFASIGEEQRIPGTRHKIDGYCEYKDENGKIHKKGFEFSGCYYHGHECIKFNRDKCQANLNYKSLDMKQIEWENRNEIYKRYLTELENIWECEFKLLMKSDPYFTNIKYQNELFGVEPIRPRDAFCGGRTECFTMIAVAGEDHKIYYYDFTSMYAYIMKYKRMPIGNPEFIAYPKENNISNYFGLAKVSILPPKKLFLPVLPMKINNKLLFGLCYSCMKDLNQSECTHSVEQRTLFSTWTTLEIQYAVNRGYKIIQVYQVVHYRNGSEYNKDKNEHSLFSEFINSLIKVKMECSDWPKWAINSELKSKYIQDVFNREGVLLNQENISDNPALKKISKLISNSLYGGFAKRDHERNTKFIKTAEEYLNILTDEQKEIKGIVFPNDEIAVISYDDFSETKKNYNSSPVISTFITAYGRLVLLEKMEYIVDTYGYDSLLYIDTDSLVFKIPSQCNIDFIDEGICLGQMTNEIDSEQETISLFISPGPKTYAMDIMNINTKQSVKQILRFKGFKFTAESQTSLNLESLLQVMLSFERGEEKCIQTKHTQFVKDRYFQIKSVDRTKVFKIKFNKRVLNVNNITDPTLPYGY